MSSEDPGNDQPTIKVGPGGQAPGANPDSGWPGHDMGQAPPTQVDGPGGAAPSYERGVPPGGGDPGGWPGMGGAGFGAPAMGMPPQTVVGGPGFGVGPMPPANNTVLIRPNQKPALAWLVVADGPYAGHLFSLSGDKMVIGREASHIVLGDPAVSAQHAAIWAESDGDGGTSFLIQDLASSNGTIVNGREELRVTMKDGDRLKLGDTSLIFKQV